MAADRLFGFGPFRLDARTKELLRDGEPVLLSPRQLDVLHELVLNAGRVVSKNHLIEVAWRGQAVSDSNLEKIIAQLRQRLDAGGSTRYIETVSRRGYRLTVPVTPIAEEPTDADLDARLVPYRALMNGRAALETLEGGQIAEALALFKELVVRYSREAGFHIGLANAYALHYESTRTDAKPDLEARQLAVEHARIARRLNPDYAEAWGTLGYVLACAGQRVEAVAALPHAVALEPDNWRHHLRLAEAGWGYQRVSAGRQTIALMGESPLAYVLVATVYVARRRLAEAEREVDAGRAAMSAAATPASRLSAVAVNWLKGLLCHVRGDDDEALAELRRELALEALGHLYSRECCANTWYAIGAIHLRHGDHAAARAAFEQAIARVPRHLMARVGLALLSGERSPAWLSALPGSIDVAVARAALLVADRDVAGAVKVVSDALAVTPPGSGGWLIPIEPLLRVWENHDAWAPVLAMLVARAK